MQRNFKGIMLAPCPSLLCEAPRFGFDSCLESSFLEEETIFLLDLRRKLNPEYKVQDNIHKPRDVYLAIFAPFLWRLLIKSAVEKFTPQIEMLLIKVKMITCC